MANLADKFSRSWRLFVCSYQIIVKNKPLLLFPLLSLCFTLGIALFFLLPVVLFPTGQPWTDAHHWLTILNRLPGVSIRDNEWKMHSPTFKIIAYSYLAVCYLLTMFSATFCNVAFYNEIIKALAGNAVSVAEGFKFARRRIRSILAWSLFAGAVGLIIQALERRSGWIGRIVMGFVGMAWSVASVFVIPVMIREESANPVTLLKNSAATLKKTWGEGLIGYIGMNLGEGVFMLVSIMALVAIGIISMMLHTVLLAILALAAWVFALFVFSYFVATASSVYRCALYVYASEGVVPTPYTADLMDGAWKVKKS
jgi:hypothetical protein